MGAWPANGILWRRARCCLLLASLGKAVARTIVRAKSQYGDRLLNETKDKAREPGIFGTSTLRLGKKYSRATIGSRQLRAH